MNKAPVITPDATVVDVLMPNPGLLNFTVADPDALSGSVIFVTIQTVSDPLHVYPAGGSILVNGIAEVRISNLTGNGTDLVRLEGTLDQIKSLRDKISLDANALTPPLAYLRIEVNDRGASQWDGEGQPRSGVVVLEVHVSADEDLGQ